MFWYEFIFVVLNAVSWLFPVYLTYVKNQYFIPLLSPQTFFPIFIFYQMLNSMMQVWTGWMGETENGILYTSQNAMISNDGYYLEPLMLLFFAGFFFHLPFIMAKPIVYQRERLIDAVKRPVKISVFSGFIIVSLMVFFILINYILPNAAFGTFWTYSLAMFSVFVLFPLYRSSKFYFIVALVVVAIYGFVLKSKAAFLFPFLSFFVYYFVSRQIKPNITFLVRMLLGLLLIYLLLSLGGFDFSARKIMHRDYAFESFSALVNDCDPVSITCDSEDVSSWTLAELGKAVPNIIHPDKANSFNPSLMVSEIFLQYDHDRLPDAYFNRFILFSGYYDLGVIGMIMQAFFIGLISNLLWGWIVKVSQRNNLFAYAYLPAPIYAGYFMSVGAFAYVFASFIIPAIIFIIIFSVLTKPTYPANFLISYDS